MNTFVQRYGFYLFLALAIVGAFVYGVVDEQVDDKEILGFVGTCIGIGAATYRGNKPSDAS